MTNTPSRLRSASEQLKGLNRVGRRAARAQCNVVVSEVEAGHGADMPPTMAAMAMGVPARDAIQVLYLCGGYDVWEKGGTEMLVADCTAEQAAEFLIRQYREYKARRLAE